MTISPLPAHVREELCALADATLREDVAFAELTTLHIGGKPRLTVRCSSAESLASAVRILDENHIEALVVGGGSNLVVADGMLPQVAVIAANDDISITGSTLVAGAGAVWDEVVELSVQRGLGGIECLSGIPGSAGATPVQNVGAYGVEIADVLSRVRLYDRRTAEDTWVSPEALELSYRYSNLKFTNRAVVLEIELALDPSGLCAPLRYGELSRRLGADSGSVRFPAAEVREHVLALRRGKGMVYDPSDHDTWSAGSFFTNPIVEVDLADEVDRLTGDDPMPRYPVAGEPRKVKLSAAWLIERAGFTKGYTLGSVGLSTRHTLALTNRGGATAAELKALACTVRAGVRERFGVTLHPEPVWVGLSFEDDAARCGS